MPIRNPFKRTAGTVELQDDNRSASHGGADRTAQISKPIDIKEPTEYKLSEINDSGVFLPPSPPQISSFWHTRSNASTTSSNHRSLLSDSEPFNISRESFDSYRRSFDISARSPISDLDTRSRQSLDSRRTRLPRASLNEQRTEKHEATVEEAFEDVGLNDEIKPKRRGIFARFGDSSDTNTSNQSDSRPSSSHYGFHFTGRKRAQSGQGAELKSIARPTSSHAKEAQLEPR